MQQIVIRPTCTFVPTANAIWSQYYENGDTHYIYGFISTFVAVKKLL